MNPVSFSSSARVWDSLDWISGIEEVGYSGWEIVADGRYRFDDPARFAEITDALSSTNLNVTVHAPYGDLNMATLNYPIWRETIRQLSTCIERASDLTDRVTVHPGYLSPAGKLVPDRAWRQQKDALVEIGRTAAGCGVLACLENMIGVKEFFCREPGELLGMTEGIEGIGITVDIGHANTVGRVAEFLPVIARADHLHVHDNHGFSDEHLPIGSGTVPWQDVGRTVAREYRGTIVVEGRSLAEAGISLAAVKGWFS